MAAARGQWLLRSPALTLGLRRAGRETIDLSLEEDETWSGSVGASRVEVRCLSGSVWVTLEGDAQDHVLSAGESFVPSHPGRLAMMAFRPARVRVAGCAGERRPSAREERARSPAA
jgi:Protein of unknown function (DUF2917)